MPQYVYACLDCEKRARRKHRSKLIHSENGPAELPQDLYEPLVLFETSHGMNPSPAELLEATECPRCKGHNAKRSFDNTVIHSYVRGYGYLDRAGAKRDMNKFHLMEKDDKGKPLDPYLEHRMPGEADHIKSTLDKQGKHNPKTIYSVPTKVMEQAVDKAVHSKNE